MHPGTTGHRQTLGDLGANPVHLRAWLAWLSERGIDVLAAMRVHVDLWVTAQQDQSAEPASIRRRLSALSSFYKYCATNDLAGRLPTVGVARPVVDPDYTATVGLTREQARALVAATDADRDPQALRTAALIRLLLHTRCGSMRPAPPTSPTSALTPTTVSCG